MPFGTVGTVCKNNCPTLCPPSKPCSSRHWDTWDSWDSQNILQRTRDMTGMLDLRHLQQTPTTGHPHPWPVLHELNETFKVGALPADDGSGLVLWPAPGLLRSEKEAALRYARDNLEALLHDLDLEHLPRQVWLAVPVNAPSKGGRPRILPDCPECGGKLLVQGTARQGHCLNRQAVCAKCGRHSRWVETPDGKIYQAKKGRRGSGARDCG